MEESTKPKQKKKKQHSVYAQQPTCFLFRQKAAKWDYPNCMFGNKNVQVELQLSNANMNTTSQPFIHIAFKPSQLILIIFFF